MEFHEIQMAPSKLFLSYLSNNRIVSVHSNGMVKL